MLAILWLRGTVDVSIIPDRNPLFVTMSDGSIRNGYVMRIMNKEHAPKSWVLGLEGADGRISVQGIEGQGPTAVLTAPPGGVASHHVFVQLPRAAVTGEQIGLGLTLEDTDTGTVTTHDTIFRGPKR
jgi:polyferredoxin